MVTRRGFTIVELLIVIVVIAILAAISVVAYTGIQDRAKDSAIKADLTNAAKAMEAAKAGSTTETYPATLPANIKPTAGNYFSLAGETNGICINVGTTADTTIRYYYSSSAGQVQSGTCPGEVIANSEVGIAPNLVTRPNFSGGYSLNIQTGTGRTLTPRAGTNTDPLPNQRVLVLNNTATTSTNWAVVHIPVDWSAIQSGQVYKMSYYTRATGSAVPNFTRYGVMNGGATTTAIPQNGTIAGSTEWQKVEWTNTATAAGVSGQAIYLGTPTGSYTTANWSLEFQDFQIRAIN